MRTTLSPLPAETPARCRKQLEGKSFAAQASGAAADCDLVVCPLPFEAWARGGAAVAAQRLFAPVEGQQPWGQQAAVAGNPGPWLTFNEQGPEQTES